MSTEEAEAFGSLSERRADMASASGARDWVAYLLSPERAQRFDLLMHLVANLGQPLAVCGPEGIGKTTFMGLLDERAFAGWHVVSVQGHNSLLYGDIIARIGEALAIPLRGGEQTTMAAPPESALAEYLRQQARNKGMLVLLLDEAGKLAPGVINTLWQFAQQHPALHLVLALRPDEAHLKSATDGAALGDCHFVDIPTLSEPYCETYLRRLATRPPRLLLPEDITPSLTRHLYHASHGVPGRIIQLLTKAPPARRKARRGVWLLLVAAVVAAAAAVALVYFMYRPAPQSVIAPKLALSATPQQAEPVKMPEPVQASRPPTHTDDKTWAATETALQGWMAELASSYGDKPTTWAQDAKIVFVPTNEEQTVISSLLDAAIATDSATPNSAITPPAPVVLDDVQQSAAPAAATVQVQPQTEAQAAAHIAPPKKTVNATATPVLSAPTDINVDVVGVLGVDWLLAQSPQAYTLRVMSAREASSLKTLLERYPAMRGQLASFKKRSGAVDWYHVYYGIFDNEAAALQAAAQLPAFLGKPLPRQLKTVQQELRAAR